MHLPIGSFRWTKHEMMQMAEVMAGDRLSYGNKTREFEEKWSSIHGFKRSVFVNSGTSALLLILQALKELEEWEDGDEVIVPALTFVATINVCLHLNLKPVLVDVRPDTFNIDEDAIEAAITPRTRAVMPVHVMGASCAMNKIIQVANKHGLRVVEDSCESALDYDPPRGCAAAFSTYMAHTVTTGVGGFASCNEPMLAVKIRSLANHGRDSIYLNIDDDKNVTQEIMQGRFKFESIGHSFRATEMEAALGLGQLERSSEIINGRRSAALQWHLGLRDTPVKPQSNSSRAPMGLAAKTSHRDELCAILEDSGIETRPLLPLLNQPCYRGMWNSEEYPVAKSLLDTAFYMGCHQDLTEKQIDYACKVIGGFFDRGFIQAKSVGSVSLPD